MKHRLMELGYEVTAVINSGEKAIQRVVGSPPDLILMDIRLRGRIDGIEAVQQIQSKFDIPVIYLTALADDDTLERTKNTKFCGFIQKPFEDRDLQNTVHYALEYCKSDNAAAS